MRRELASPLATAAAATAGASSSAAASLRGWWDDVNESPQWQDGAFFSLAAAYALVSAVALVRPPSLPSLPLWGTTGPGRPRHGSARAGRYCSISTCYSPIGAAPAAKAKSFLRP
jgi:hypothetical protein